MEGKTPAPRWEPPRLFHTAKFSTWFARARPALVFLAAWTALNVIVNVRYPGSEPRYWCLLPCIDLVGLFGLYVALGRTRRSVPTAVHAVLVAAFVLARLVRFADGISTTFLNRQFNLYVDAVLFPEVVRLMLDTLPWHTVVLGAFAVLASLVAVAYVAHRALRVAEQFLREPQQARVFGAVVAVTVLASPLVPERTKRDPKYAGAFTQSVVGRLAAEAMYMLQVPHYVGTVQQRIAAVASEFERTPSNLTELGGADVLLFVVESYGEAMLSHPERRAVIRPLYETYERELGGAGYTMASDLLDSPTYGGGSWLAHATLATGVRTTDQLFYDILTGARPPALAQFFRDAGYRTVLVQPATRRPSAQGDYLAFEFKYFARELDYRGPAFGWGKVPDQYVLDRVHRREAEQAAGPRFIEYALVTSHAPWSVLPPIVDDWSSIGDGSRYAELPAERFPTTWNDLAAASGAYAASIRYELEILKRYLLEFVQENALVIIVGDHQPPGERLGGREPTHAVPVHVLSRRANLVAPFVRRGYTEGMLPRRVPPYPGMETFPLAFVRDFSAARAQGRL